MAFKLDIWHAGSKFEDEVHRAWTRDENYRSAIAGMVDRS